MAATSTAPAGTPTDIRGVRIPEPSASRFQKYSMLAATIIPLIGLVVAIVLLWGSGISELDLGLLIGGYALTGLGITAGYHRLLTHRSFDAPTPVRVAFAIAGSLALQGSVIDWVATHRRHHAFSDEYGDPHSPHVDASEGLRGIVRGLYHAHLGWMFKPEQTLHETWAPDLLKEGAIVRVHRAFPLFALATFTIPALVGFAVTGTLAGAVTAFIWGSLVRVFLLHHVTWAINSICHFFGSTPFDAHDESRNNVMMALLAFGEGWHNAHHAFPASARHGLRWWELDLSWLTIKSLEVVGLASNLKIPTETQLARKAR